jgi:hypothetical protein
MPSDRVVEFAAVALMAVPVSITAYAFCSKRIGTDDDAMTED